jgi:hypothetical protein
MTVTLVDGQLISQATGQGKVPLFAESETMFRPKDINAEIEFPKDETGPASQLILHQNGRDLTGKRLDDAEAKKIADTAAAFEKRFKAQTAAPGSEGAVRRMIDELRTGKPNYDLMSPGLAEATRQQLPRLQSMIAAMGALQSVIFKGVGPGGADIYQVNFEKNSVDYRIWLGADGKVDSANLRPSEYPIPIVATAESLHPQLVKIDSMIASEFASRPVGSVTEGVVVGKQLIWSKSYGEADMEMKTPANADTVYRIGSITKMFTALMLEQLVEAGKVHFSDPVEKYFPEIKAVQGKFPDAPPITLIQLATHTSGLAREPDNIDAAPPALFRTGRIRSSQHYRICIINLSLAPAFLTPTLDSLFWARRCLAPPASRMLTTFKNTSSNCSRCLIRPSNAIPRCCRILPRVMSRGDPMVRQTPPRRNVSMRRGVAIRCQMAPSTPRWETLDGSSPS